MNPLNKIRGIVVVAILAVSAALTVIISTSVNDTSVRPSFANSEATNKSVAPAETVAQTLTPTAAPTLLRVKNQDVPITVLGTKEDDSTHSFLYTELTSKGIVGNVTDKSAHIYWITEAPQQTLLRYGTNAQSLNRQASGLTPVHLHEATLTSLIPNTVYYYTGHAPVIDSVTTPGTLKFASLTRKLSGTFKNGSGQCIVRAVFSRNGLSSSYAIGLSTTTSWQLSIGTLRTADLTAYYTPASTDQVELDALCVTQRKILYSGVKRSTFGEVSNGTSVLPLAREN